MTTWNSEITKAKGDQFPWKAAVVAKNGKRQEAGEFLDEKEARSYATMELRRLMAKEKPNSAERPELQVA